MGETERTAGAGPRETRDKRVRQVLLGEKEGSGHQALLARPAPWWKGKRQEDLKIWLLVA